MTAKNTYLDYVADNELLTQYEAYQQRYRTTIRESDKKLLRLIQGVVGDKPGRLLDVGCSTGNFLHHLKALLPSLELTGVDLSRSAIQKCRNDRALSGIAFEERDMLDLSFGARFDVVTANAVTVYFDWDQYRAAMTSVYSVLSPGGTYIAFEWLHPFSVQDLTIVETNALNPDGLKFHFRPISRVESVLRSAGFSQVQFLPFELPIDLPCPGHDADVVTYTRKDEYGHRLAFRGALYQPWCHMVARKA